MRLVDGNTPVSDNDWESITGGGDGAIQRWIDGQMHGRSCVIVLIGSRTADRKWIKYEIEKAWTDGKGLLGVYIHQLKNQRGRTATRGRNPFEDFTVGNRKLSNIVKAYGLQYSNSRSLYAHIGENLANWVEEAIEIRRNF